MRIKMSVKPLIAAAVVVGALAMSSSAMASAPTGIWAPFKYCPYQNTAITSCILSTSTSGSFTLGNTSVPITASTPVTLQGAFRFNDDGSSTWYDAANGGQSLPPQPLKVPGGLIGLVSTGGWSGVLIDLFNAAVAAGNDVYATAEQAGPIRFDYLAFLLQSGPTVTLPIKIHLTNPFLGPSCYIGSNSNPITLNLTDGTTSPPAPNTPITGAEGTTTTDPTGNLVTQSGVKLVDNSFSVPAASNCGYLLLDKLLITAGVNLREGFPSAAGRNSAILQGTILQGGGDNVAASVR